MSSVPPRSRRAYLVGNGVAMGITLLAGLINLVLGPRNLLILAVVPFQLVFASCVLFFAETVGQQPEAPPFWVGKRGFPSLETWEKKTAGHRERTMRGFLTFTSTFFLVISFVLLFMALTRTIDPQ
jgi:hypothetical protein